MISFAIAIELRSRKKWFPEFLADEPTGRPSKYCIELLQAGALTVNNDADYRFESRKINGCRFLIYMLPFSTSYYSTCCFQTRLGAGKRLDELGRAAL